MQERRKKRKQAELLLQSSPSIKIKDPYPDFSRPTPEECRGVRDDLLALHGFPQEFLKYQRKQTPNHSAISEPSDGGGGPSEAEKESVLDGLVSTILSQNTTDANSRRAFASLKSLYPSWEDVRFLFAYFSFSYCC